MPSTTSRLGFQKPAPGDLSDANAMAANFDILDKFGQNDGVRYAHPSGDDGEDGLTWATAKQTIMAAYDALTVNGGTVYFASGTSATSVAGQGIWLVGANDPSFASPPTGFRQNKRCRFIGVGGKTHAANTPGFNQAAIVGGSSSDRSKPVIWLSGTNTPLSFENIHIFYPAVAIRIGVAPNDSTNRNVNTAGIRFRNFGIDLNQVTGNGPAIDMGYCFWVWFEDGVIGANSNPSYTLTAASITAGTTARFTIGTHYLEANNYVQVMDVTPSGYNGVWKVTAVGATTFDADIGTSPGAGSVFGHVHPVVHERRAAVFMRSNVDGSGSPPGLIRFSRVNFNNGGILYNPKGATSWGNISIEDSTYEGDWGVHAQPPLFGVRNAGQGFGGQMWIRNVEMADADSSQFGAVWTDQQLPDETYMVLSNVNGGIRTKGGIVVNLANHLDFADQQQIGFGVFRRIYGIHDGVRRSFAPTVARFTNLAPQDVSTWGSKIGSATVTTGKTAPDGTTNAAELSSASGSAERQIYRTARTVNVGDWIIGGVWTKGPMYQYGSGGAIGMTNTIYHFARSGVNYANLTPVRYADDDWQWEQAIGKVSEIDGAATDVYITLRAYLDYPMTYYAPILIHIPASAGYTDSEIYAWYDNLTSWPDTVPVGSISTMRGQKLIAWGGLGVGNDVAANTLGSVTKKIEVFDETGASIGFLPVYGSIT